MDLRFKWTERFDGEWDRIMDVLQSHQTDILLRSVIILAIMALVSTVVIFMAEKEVKLKLVFVNSVILIGSIFIGLIDGTIVLNKSTDAIGKGYYQSDVVTVTKIEKSNKTVTGDYGDVTYTLGKDPKWSTDIKWSTDHELKGIKEGDKVRLITKKADYVTKDSPMKINYSNYGQFTILNEFTDDELTLKEME